MRRASANDDVAAGDGALRTCSARSVSDTTKSSTSVPSRPSAWARRPAKPPSKSRGPISGTYSAAAAASARRLSAWWISVIPVRHQRRAMRHVPGQARSRAAFGASSAVGPSDTWPSMWRLRCTPRNGREGSGTG
jgi:hypothetical protein